MFNTLKVAPNCGADHGSTMHETVPDSVLDLADIELIDISPEDLMRRLDEGKVYLPDRAAVAMVNFFSRRQFDGLGRNGVASRSGTGAPGRARLHAGDADPGPWKTGHALVAVSPALFPRKNGVAVLDAAFG